MKITGVLERVDLGAGGWAICAAEGRYVLHGDVPASLAGQRVVVEGNQTSASGFLMTGDLALDVRRIRKA